MCGISILINKRNEAVEESLIRQVNEKVKHRGPDGEGFFFEKNFAFGHRRLSIVDLSDAGHQPMQFGDDWIVFNGMIYNYIELKEELINLGHHFNSNCDTEILLAACSQWGIDAFDKLNGMWAFAWYRKSLNDIVFCRDRYGIKPLYYTSAGDYFSAGSEIKQFTVLPAFAPVLNKNAAVNFLAHGYLNYSSDTFFEGVHELRPGHYLVYDLSTHHYKVSEWYNLNRAAVKQKVSWKTATQEVRRLFDESVRLRMRADVAVGSCLSGGLDSSSMVANIHMQQIVGDNFVTITSCYNDRRYDEQEYSDLVTTQTGFKALKVFPELSDLIQKNQLDEMLYHQDQPFSTASHYSEHEVFRIAGEQRLKVMLDGQGADEYICGYNEFYVAHLNQLFASCKFFALWKAFKLKAAHKKTSVGNYIKDYLRSAILYRFIGDIKKATGKKQYPWLSSKLRSFAADNKFSYHGKSVRSLSLTEMSYTSLPFQLHSEDRNSMMHAVESRLPYLDHRLVEYILGLPVNYKINDGFSKYIMRETLTEIPEKIRFRKDKMGFVAPDEPWIRENHELIREELNDAVQKHDLFSTELLDRFDRFMERKLGFEPLYFRVITLNRFMKIFKMQVKLLFITKLVFCELGYC